MVSSWRGGLGAWRLLMWLLLLTAWETESSPVHYSVSEEAKHGTFVGRIVQDLGLELEELVPRLFRMASKSSGDLLEINLQNGILFVNSRIDREELCGRRLECSIHLEVIVERPLQVFHVQVEVKDINDNLPVFRREQKVLISESAPLESQFPLEGAFDADIGENSVLTYKLSLNEYFTLKTITKNDKSILPELVLRKSLDREETPELNVLLTALDGGKPELTGSIHIKITILDVNDNAPEFDKLGYKVVLFENVPNDTRVIQLNASDLDEGLNSEITYGIRMILPASEKCMFSIDPKTGEIRIYGKLDFEENNEYEIHVNAIDKGIPSMAGYCTVLVEVLDLNDNTPKIMVTSLSLPVREDAQVGTVIALVSVSDSDSGANGQVTCSLTPHVPFKLVSTFKNYYSLVLDSALDRESVANYELVVTAQDGGSPSLSATASVSVEVADVNDNAPDYILNSWETESSPVHYSVSEEAKHGTFVGRIVQDLGLELEELVPRLFRMASKSSGDLLEINLQNGILFVNSRIDREELFRVGLYTGEISTTRALDEADAPRQRLLVLVKDHGEPALAATATVLLSLMDSGQVPKTPSQMSAGAMGPEAALVDVNVYLIIAICAVSSLLVLTLLLYTALRCSAPPTQGACEPLKPTLVCSSAVGSWSYSQQRRQRVCSGEGLPKSDLMAFSPSLPPCLSSAEETGERESDSKHLKESRRRGRSRSRFRLYRLRPAVPLGVPPSSAGTVGGQWVQTQKLDAPFSTVDERSLAELSPSYKS
ncbi:protocadherin alpha-12-like [Pteropus vampyrus]|uniref:Protocadherin alpha-12-like n=1 Tax=Pteropus vampyrus TaxID=132908 RepID=A0A6P6BYT9_PTEVA|nr:protocadherin alpha-12-like [Pteropus vampyrus]